MPHALPLYRADAVRAIERAAFARGVDAFGLMTQAGEAAAALLRERWPGARRVGVLCGSGNNGGDGYVAALALHHAGLDVALVACGEPRTPAARAAAERWQATGQGVQGPASPLPEVDAWIDGLFGIGLSRAPEATVAALMQAVDTHPDLQGLRRQMLVTRDAHGLYEKFGFRALASPAQVMEKHRPDVYRRALPDQLAEDTARTNAEPIATNTIATNPITTSPSPTQSPAP